MRYKFCMLYSIIAMFLFQLSVNVVFANESSKSVLFVGFGVEFGGDDVSSEIKNQNTVEDREVILGSGGYLKLGLNKSFTEKFDSLISISYLFGGGLQEKISSYAAVTSEMLGLYKHEKHRFGGGVIYHNDPKVRACQVNDVTNEAYCSTEKDLSFDNALGLVVQYDYLMDSRRNIQVQIELRYTFIWFESDSIDRIINGSGLGIGLSIKCVVDNRCFY